MSDPIVTVYYYYTTEDEACEESCRKLVDKPYSKAEPFIRDFLSTNSNGVIRIVSSQKENNRA